MRTIRIYTELPLAENQTIELEKRPAHHLANVLRIKQGAEIVLFNGKGGEYLAKVTSVSKRSVVVETGSYIAESRQSNLTIELGLGISRGDRVDWAVQKATELGVSKITPLRTEFCEVRLNAEREQKKLDHWQQIAIAASEQSGLNVPPTISPISDLSSWVSAVDAERKLVLHPELEQGSLQQAENPSSIALLIGPVAGFSDSEVELAQKNGFEAILLGPRVMRTETAPVAALSIVQWLWGDLGG